MLTGQEIVREIFDRSPEAGKVLLQYGITVEAAEHLKYKNLAHAAIVQKIPLRKILEDLSAVTGEEIAEVKVKGIAAVKPGVRKGGLENIKRIVAVHSGKGGVGKTFVAVNLAAFLAGKGLKVGLLDADVDCPNVLQMLKGKDSNSSGDGKLLANEEKMIVPLEKFGMKIISMAPLLENEDEVLMWRGPIVSRVLEQFLYDVAWGKLDVLVVDLPPGTSDIPLTLYHMLPRSEVLLVTTPHQLGLLDAKKAAAMARKLGVKILGIVENMGGEIFGKESSAEMAVKLGIPFLGSIPLQTSFAQIHKDGKPHVLENNELRNLFEKAWKVISKQTAKPEAE